MNASTRHIAQVYAEALLGLTEDLDQCMKALKSYVSLIQGNPSLKKLFEGEVFTPEEKERVVKEINEVFSKEDPKSFNQHFQNFMIFLARENRLAILDGILECFEELVYEKRNQALALVETASELDEAQIDALKQALNRKTGREIFIKQEVNPDLIGGLVVNMQGRTYDSSLRSQFRSLVKQLSAHE
jgi:ATP synthase F1 delta subunit